MFDGIFNFFAQLLAWFYDIAGSYAGAIAILTVAVNIVLAPLTLKATRASIDLQRWAPELKKIQAAHADDREAQAVAMQEFYRERNLNPLGGCLPQLVQAPIFLVLYQVMRGLFRRGDGPGDPANFDPKYLDSCCPESALNTRLEGSNEALSLGLDLSRTPLNVIQESIFKGIPYLILIGLVALSGWYQHRQIQGRNPNASAMNPQQAMILKYLPFMLPIFSFSFATGLVIYFVVGNLWRVGLQTFITRKYYGDGALDLAEEDALDEDQVKEAAARAKSRSEENRARKTGAAGGAQNGSNKGGSNKSGSNKSGSNGAKKNGSGTKKGASSNGRSVGGRFTGDDDEVAESRHGRRSGSASSRPRPKPKPKPKSDSDNGDGGGRPSAGGRVTPAGTQGNANRKKRKKR